MIVFELTMPHVGSWNGKLSCADKRYIRTMCERQVPRDCWDKDFYYRWDDGWWLAFKLNEPKQARQKS